MVETSRAPYAGDATRPRSVTVVVSTFQRAELLRRMLSALEAQTYPSSMVDVVVVDNGSSDHTPAVLDDARARIGDRLTVLRNSANRSVVEARNRAIAVARGEVIAFTDDDCRPTPGWLDALVAAFDDGVGIVQGRTVPDPSQFFGVTSRSQRTTREHGLYETCNLAIRRADLDRLGSEPFSTTMPERMRALLGETVGAMAFGEDVDLVWRLRRLGVTTAFETRAIVYHHVSDADLGYLFRRSLQVAGFPALVRSYPELRSQFLYRHWFLSRRHMLACAALCGLAARRRGGALVTLPYLYDLVGPRRGGRRVRLLRVPLRAARDVVETGALVYGSVRERTLVL